MADEYARSQLNGGETILHSGQMHWIIFIDPGLSAAVFLVLAGTSHSSTWRYVFYLLAGLTLLGCLWRWIEYRTTEMVITNRRVISKSGFIVRSTHEQQLAKIENVKLTQGLIGRLLGYGKIELIGTGGSTTSLKMVEDVEEFKNTLSDALQKLSEPMQSAQRPTNELSATRLL